MGRAAEHFVLPLMVACAAAVGAHARAPSNPCDPCVMLQHGPGDSDSVQLVAASPGDVAWSAFALFGARTSFQTAGHDLVCGSDEVLQRVRSWASFADEQAIARGPLARLPEFLGRGGDPEAVEAMVGALAESDALEPELRLHAVALLRRRLGDIAGSCAAWRDLVETAKDPILRAVAMDDLTECPPRD
jgi:hypothetical protein